MFKEMSTSYCCLTLEEQFFSHIMTRSGYIFITWCPLCTRPTHLDLCIMLTHKNKSLCRHVTAIRRIILIPSEPVFAANANCIHLGLTRPCLEHMIYHSKDDHTNYLMKYIDLSRFWLSCRGALLHLLL